MQARMSYCCELDASSQRKKISLESKTEQASITDDLLWQVQTTGQPILATE